MYVQYNEKMIKHRLAIISLECPQCFPAHCIFSVAPPWLHSVQPSNDITCLCYSQHSWILSQEWFMEKLIGLVLPGSVHFIKMSKSLLFPSRREDRHDRIQPSSLCVHAEFIFFPRFHQFKHTLGVINLLIWPLGVFWEERPVTVVFPDHGKCVCDPDFWVKVAWLSEMCSTPPTWPPPSQFLCWIPRETTQEWVVQQIPNAFTFLLNRSVQVSFSFPARSRKHSSLHHSSVCLEGDCSGCILWYW